MEHRIRKTTYVGSMAMATSQGLSVEENWSCLLHDRDMGSWETVSSQGRTYPIGRINRDRFNKLDSVRYCDDLTLLEKLLYYVILKVLAEVDQEIERERCRLIVSTTKGNIDLLANPLTSSDEALYLDVMAQKVSAKIGFLKRPIVVSNACISGLSSLIVGSRLIEEGDEETIIVPGGDLISDFIFSGFESFKSLSTKLCRPYDVMRDGLTLGEGVGAILLTNDKSKSSGVSILGGSITNDANHISGPSRTGDGLSLAINRAINEGNIQKEQLSFINMHGTATLFNDEMESKALALSGLNKIPVNGLKGYVGHTLGGAGIIETILCIKQLQENILLGTKGYEQCGCPVPLNITNRHQQIEMQGCLKTASGFGGCNAALVIAKDDTILSHFSHKGFGVNEISSCSVYDGKVLKNGETVFESSDHFALFIREAFKRLDSPNMKFYKMDDLSKLGYLTASYLLSDQILPSEDSAIVLWNHSSSLDTDLKHNNSIIGEEPTGASPSVFVYTLPNIVMGEIAIRFGIKGENTFFIQDDDDNSSEEYGRKLLSSGRFKYVVVGKCDYFKEKYSAAFKLIGIK